MTAQMAAIALAGFLVACASSEDKAKARFAGWSAECGYPTGQGLRVSPDEERELRACVLAHEQAWQAHNRSVWIAPVPPTPAPSVQCITIPHGEHLITRCQ